MERLGHELKHGSQFLMGEIDFAVSKDKKERKGGIYHDQFDERDAFLCLQSNLEL